MGCNGRHATPPHISPRDRRDRARLLAHRRCLRRLADHFTRHPQQHDPVGGRAQPVAEAGRSLIGDDPLAAHRRAGRAPHRPAWRHRRARSHRRHRQDRRHRRTRRHRRHGRHRSGRRPRPGGTVRRHRAGEPIPARHLRGRRQTRRAAGSVFETSESLRVRVRRGTGRAPGDGRDQAGRMPRHRRRSQGRRRPSVRLPGRTGPAAAGDVQDPAQDTAAGAGKSSRFGFSVRVVAGATGEVRQSGTWAATASP